MSIYDRAEHSRRGVLRSMVGGSMLFPGLVSQLLADEAKSIGLIEEIITAVRIEEVPIERTEEKKTVTLTRDLDSRLDGANEPAKIPKRRD